MIKCNNCGYECDDNDVYCEQCGNKLTQTNESTSIKKQSKSKKILITISIVIVVFIGFMLILGSTSQDIEMNANDLAEILNSEDKISEYKGDTLHVDGYFLNFKERQYFDDELDLNSFYNNDAYENMYAIYLDENSDNFAFFIYEDGIEDDVGSGSKITLTGKIEEVGDTKTPVLMVEDIEVKDKKEPIYMIDSIKYILDNKDELMNKKISVTGTMRFGESLVFLEDTYSQEDYPEPIVLDMNYETAYYSLGEGTTVTITGKVKEDSTGIYIAVDEWKKLDI